MVLGPHRSGTSVVTRALVAAEVDLGYHLIEPNADNPKGFFENARIVQLNDQLLKALGLCWDYPGPFDWARYQNAVEPKWREAAASLLREEFPAAQRIAIKDPRLCFLAPFWEDVLQSQGFELQYVLVLRHPAESAQSQCMRYQRDPVFHHLGATFSEGVLLWANYTQAALSFLSGRTFFTAAYARFLARPHDCLQSLATALDLQIASSARLTYADSFIDEALRRHHTAEVVDKSEALAPYVAAYQAMLDAPADPATVGQQLRDAMVSDPELQACMLRSYVQARHSSVEANLELKKAGNIIAYQTWALEDAQKRVAEAERSTAAAKEQFIAERRENERLALALAACKDRATQKR